MTDLTAKAYYKKLLQLFQDNRISEQAAPMAAYMKNHFEFLGLKSPSRKLLLRAFFKENGIPEGEKLKAVIDLMWNDPFRELQYAAMDIIEKASRKLDASHLPFLEKLILKKSWWDTVDWLAPNGCGKIFQKHPELILPITERWNQSDNMWLQRSSILFQLKYRHETDFDLLKKYILHHSDSKEFFIQKAAGWALRQYGKYNPTVVKQFIEENQSILAPLTVREGGKYLG